MFNSAYSTGGAACAVKTVESMTGIRMDHYIEVDFSGFQKLIDDLGGVEVTTTKDIKDPDSHLNLTAGTHTLDGEQALGLVRTRHGVGDGSDLGRIQLQQAFIKALVDQVKHVGVLTNPKKLFDLADTATKAVTTDSDLGSVTALTSFASGLKSISSDRHDHGHDAGPVRPGRTPTASWSTRPRRALVWNALKADQPDPGERRPPKGDAAGVVSRDKGAPLVSPRRLVSPHAPHLRDRRTAPLGE